MLICGTGSTYSALFDGATLILLDWCSFWWNIQPSLTNGDFFRVGSTSHFLQGYKWKKENERRSCSYIIWILTLKTLRCKGFCYIAEIVCASGVLNNLSSSTQKMNCKSVERTELSSWGLWPDQLHSATYSGKSGSDWALDSPVCVCYFWGSFSPCCPWSKGITGKVLRHLFF